MSKFIRSAVPFVLLGALMLAIIYLLTSVTPMYKIATGSMEPTLPTGSRIIIHEQSDYQAGDVITFHADNGDVVTHRLIEFADNGELITKGDANPTPDDWNESVTRGDVIGKVVFMTAITTFDFWKSWRAVGIMLCAAGVILLMTTGGKVEEGADNQVTQEEQPETSPV